MKPLTEQDLRLALKEGGPLSSYAVPAGTLVTPAAEEFLRQERIELLQLPAAPQPSSAQPAASTGQSQSSQAPRWDFSDPKSKNANPEEAPKQLFFGPDGGSFDHKPESLTHLKGRQLVHKDHPVIIFRGKLDSFCSKILEAQLRGHEQGNARFVAELQEILDFSRRLLACEIKGQMVEDFNLLGLDAAALRARSHNPMKFFGHRHMMASYRMGPLCLALNSLRTEVREVELAAAAAFKDGSGASSRDDIIRALNRLSSLFYIMMFQYLPEGFEPEPSGI